MINVMLLDDHQSFRQPFAFMLEREPDITIVMQAGSLAEARSALKVKSIEVNIAIVDLDLPDGNGIDIISDLRAHSPHAAVLVLTASGDRRQFARVVEAGASGIMNKSARIAEITEALRRLSRGEHLFSPLEVVELLRMASQQRDRDRDAQLLLRTLTPREFEVLQALADGLGDKDIAQRLHISTQTVQTHMSNILSKLGVESRLQALVFAVRHGAVHIH